MKNEMNNMIYNTLKNDPNMTQLLRSWDKGDCSSYGLLNLMMIKECQDHIAEHKDYADDGARKMLEFCLNWREKR